MSSAVLPVAPWSMAMMKRPVVAMETLAAGASATLHFRAMVPGLASIPQSLIVESIDP